MVLLLLALVTVCGITIANGSLWRKIAVGIFFTPLTFIEINVQPLQSSQCVFRLLKLYI